MPEPQPVHVCVRDLTKRYGAVEAVRGVSFDVAEGEIFGLLGPNGAGKTSILECVLGLRRPDSGSVSIGGLEVERFPERARERVGAQIQLSSLQDTLTAREALCFFGSFYRNPAPVEGLIERFELSAKADAPFGSLSGGQRQRLFLALAFVNQPTLVVLDEPTAGLDVHSRLELHGLIQSLRSTGQTVLLSTHYLEEAHLLCDRVAIMSEGRIVAAASPAELISRSRAQLRLVIRTSKAVSPEGVSALPGVTACSVEGSVCRLETTEVGRTITALVSFLEANQNPLLDLQVQRPSLEDVFVELTGRAWSAAGREDGA